MLVFCFLLEVLSSFAVSAPQHYFKVEEFRLKNGAHFINTNLDSINNTKIVSIFTKNGASLRFDNRTALPSLAFDAMFNRMTELASKYGFRFEAELDWEYSSFLLFISDDVFKNKFTSIIDAIFSDYKATPKKKQDFPSMLSLMSTVDSLYSKGLYGSDEDILSVSNEDFNTFMQAYINPMNMAFVFSNLDKKTKKEIVAKLEGIKPVFKDARFINEDFKIFKTPKRKINYLKANGKNTILRLGYLLNKDSYKDTYVYDILTELLKMNIVYNCDTAFCVLEFIISDPRIIDDTKGLDEFRKTVIKRSLLLDDDYLKQIKLNLKSKYINTMSKKERLVFLLGLYSAVKGNLSSLLNYQDELDAVTLTDVKKNINNLVNDTPFINLIRLEGGAL